MPSQLDLNRRNRCRFDPRFFCAGKHRRRRFLNLWLGSPKCITALSEKRAHKRLAFQVVQQSIELIDDLLRCLSRIHLSHSSFARHSGCAAVFGPGTPMSAVVEAVRQATQPASES